MVGKTKRSRGGRGKRRGRSSVGRTTCRAARRGRRELSKLAAAPQLPSPPQTEPARKGNGANRLGYLRRRRANWMERRFIFVEDGLRFSFRGGSDTVPDRSRRWGPKREVEPPSDVPGLAPLRASDWDLGDRFLFWLRLERLGKALVMKSYSVPPPFVGRRGRPNMYKWFVRFWEMRNGTWQGVSGELTDGFHTYPLAVLQPQIEKDLSELTLPDVGPGYEGSSRSRIDALRQRNRRYRRR